MTLAFVNWYGHINCVYFPSE